MNTIVNGKGPWEKIIPPHSSRFVNCSHGSPPPLFPLRESHLEVAAGKVPDEKDNRRKEAGAHVEENHRGASLVFLKRACEAKGIGCQTEMSAKEL